MNYELSKQLKDAGFPQSDAAFLPDPNCPNLASLEAAGHTDHCSVYPPTLSELIEACGFSFESLSYSSGFNSQRGTETLVWVVRGYKHGKLIDVVGSLIESPEEAVARLWLALQKK